MGNNPPDQYNQFSRERPAMTYCIGILVREGLVLFADTRTSMFG